MQLRALLKERLEALKIRPSPEFLEGTISFWELFRKEAPSLGLTAHQSFDAFLRPVTEALFLARQLPPKARCVDLGAGAGIPGLLVKLARPDLQLTLIEAVDKRVVFMNQAIATLGLKDTRAVCCHVGFKPCEVRAPLAIGRGYGAVDKFVRHAFFFFRARKAFYLFRHQVEKWRPATLPLFLKAETPLPGGQTSLLVFESA